MIEIAIIGSGAAGLGALYALDASQIDCRFTVYENGDHVGGHANTVNINEKENSFPIDTGFMVFNEVTYPNLLSLFKQLDVPRYKTDMSFSVQHRGSGLEYAGASWSRLFGQRSNVLNWRFWMMLLQLDRFNREAEANLSEPKYARMTLREYVATHAYGDDFLKLYIIPMAGAVWSTPAEKMLEFPATTLLRFFSNHGFLGMNTQHQWWTVNGGAKVYIEKLLANLTRPVEFLQGAKTIVSGNEKVSVEHVNGDVRSFDKVIVACHADEARVLLAEHEECARTLLANFEYQTNDTCVHTDQSVMPVSKNCWSSWNYRIDENGSSSTHYWMNSLQYLPTRTNYFVSLNARNIIDPKTVVRQMEYQHPLFTHAAIDAQSGLKKLNLENSRRVFFAGSYMRYGFHEDAFTAGLEAASALLGGVHAQQFQPL